MKTLTKSLLAISLSALSAGCSFNTTHISEISEGQFIANLEGGRTSSRSALFSKIYEDAKVFCEKQGKKLKIINQEFDSGNLRVHKASPYVGPTNTPGGAFAAGFASTFSFTTGTAPSASVGFVCVEATSVNNQELNKDRYILIDTSKDGSSRYFDVFSVKPSERENILIFSELITHKEHKRSPEGLRGSIIVTNEVDCRNNTIRPVTIQSFHSFDGSGQPLTKEIELGYTAMKPNTEYEKDVTYFVCKKKK